MPMKIKRDWSLVDPFKVPKSVELRYGKEGDRYHYCYARAEDDRITLKEGLGYEVVKIEPKETYDKKGKPWIQEGKGSTLKNYVQMGDNILMMLPIEDWKDRQETIESELKKKDRTIKQTVEDSSKSIDLRLSTVGEVKSVQGTQNDGGG